jgi:hypothetical protein
MLLYYQVDNISNLIIYSYQQRWRDWPDEARQPAIINIAMVPIPGR